MRWQFNPFTGQLDQTGSGGGGGNPFDQSLNTTDSPTFSSASFSSGSAHINTDGTASFYGISTDGHVVTMGDFYGTIKAGNLYNAPSFELWNSDGRAAYFYAGGGDCGIFDARSASTNFGMKITPDVSVSFGNYTSPVASINADGSISMNGGTLSSPDGVSLYWNGTQIA